jgi:hypothetical protein
MPLLMVRPRTPTAAISALAAATETPGGPLKPGSRGILDACGRGLRLRYRSESARFPGNNPRVLFDGRVNQGVSDGVGFGSDRVKPWRRFRRERTQIAVPFVFGFLCFGLTFPGFLI